MRTTATMTSKGRLTLPKQVREQLGLRPGDAVELVSEDGQLVLRPTRQVCLGWAGAFAEMRAAGDDVPDPELPTAFDDEEWTW